MSPESGTPSPKRPDLRAPAWSDAALERDAEIIPRDIDDAKAWWRQHAPKGFEGLLDAETEEPDA